MLIADIKFHDKNPKTMLFNEIYTPIFEKNKTVQAYEMDEKWMKKSSFLSLRNTSIF